VSYGDLQLARLACVVLVIAILIAAFGDSANWWRIEKTIASLWWVGALAFVLLYIFLGDRMPDALERQRAAYARQQKEKRQRDSDAAIERERLRQAARDKAIAIARADYPDHFDSDALEDRGWRDDADNVDMIAEHLDPPEIVLKYEVAEAEEEIRLYDRARVVAAEENPDVEDHIRTVLSDREYAAEARRKEEEQARLDAKEAAAEEEEKREQEHRLAQQKIIRIDDRLK
jgi:hypothetical protein